MNVKIIVSTFCVGLFSQIAFACSCSEKRSIEQEVEGSDLVALVEILSVEEVYVSDPELTKSFIDQGISINEQNRHLVGEYLKKVTIQLINTYKSSGGKQVDAIYTPKNEAACGFQFKEGKKYIIYADKNESLNKLMTGTEDVLSTNICYRTKKKNRKELKAISKILK